MGANARGLWRLCCGAQGDESDWCPVTQQGREAGQLRLGSLVLEVENEFEDLIGQAAGVYVVHVGQDDDTSASFGDQGKRRASSLLPAGMGKDVHAKLIREAPPEAVAGGLAVRGL